MINQRDLRAFDPRTNDALRSSVNTLTANGRDYDTRLKDLESHTDRLYERYHDLWDAVEKLSEGIAQTVPLPLKYK